MTKNHLRIGLVQMRCQKNPADNLKKALSQVRIAARKGAQIVCLQELFNTPYFCQGQKTEHFDLAETIPGPVTDALANLARKEKVALIAPLFEKYRKGVYYNSAAVIDSNGELIGKYRKMHIPDDPGFNEKFYFSPGDLGFKTFKIKSVKISVLICWDQWFPEAARMAALDGADILFYPTAIGWKPNKPKETEAYHSAWETIQRSHAIANGVFVAATNRVGQEGALRFWGQSFVADPFGAVLYRASEKDEEIVIADCDLAKVEQTRREWPFFRDRRMDAYQAISSRSVEKKN